MEFWSNTFTGCGGWREEKSWLELLLWVMAVMLIPVHFVDSPHVDFRYTWESASPFYLKFYKKSLDSVTNLLWELNRGFSVTFIVWKTSPGFLFSCWKKYIKCSIESLRYSNEDLGFNAGTWNCKCCKSLFLSDSQDFEVPLAPCHMH